MFSASAVPPPKTSGKTHGDRKKPERSVENEYKDADADILVYVESDRRHVAALDKNGEVIWCKVPSQDPDIRLCLKQFQIQPFITSLQKPTQWRLKGANYRKAGNYVEIRYDTLSVVLDEQTGVVTHPGDRD